MKETKIDAYLANGNFFSAKLKNVSSYEIPVFGGKTIKPKEEKTLEQLGITKEKFDKFLFTGGLSKFIENEPVKIILTGIENKVSVKKENEAAKEEEIKPKASEVSIKSAESDEERMEELKNDIVKTNAKDEVTELGGEVGDVVSGALVTREVETVSIKETEVTKNEEVISEIVNPLDESNKVDVIIEEDKKEIVEPKPTTKKTSKKATQKID